MQEDPKFKARLGYIKKDPVSNKTKQLFKKKYTPNPEIADMLKKGRES
jgi:hypothetical protein